MAKQVIFGAEARESMLKGIDILARAVRATLGPKGSQCGFGQVVWRAARDERWRDGGEGN